MRVETIGDAESAQVKDYRVTVKVRNNRILKAIEEAGGQTGGKWCEENGLEYLSVNNYISMKISPITKDGQLKTSAIKLCEVLNKIPDELWSAEQLYPLEKNFAELEMDSKEINNLLEANQHCEIDESAIENRQHRQLLESAFAKLKKREVQALKLVYFDEKTFEDAGKVLGVSGCRVAVICEGAIRKTRGIFARNNQRVVL